ncbi:hypothetical protein EJ04DRAFT_22253 [Polyplosphaeria fusca]|uniref:Uncharacterized protein n=1 Tax=Polyplosphaeria fusca TaxID=682080 RepID=A0A9P4QU42_9PLEO|nr:hypothetical protein EJ04DRAFT_22253 [Polyplosphaeria fusca]
MPALPVSAPALSAPSQLLPRSDVFSGSSEGISSGAIALIVCVGIVPVIIVFGVVIWGMCIYGRVGCCCRRKSQPKQYDIKDSVLEDSSSDSVPLKHLPAPPARLVKANSDSSDEFRYSQTSSIVSQGFDSRPMMEFEPNSPRSPTPAKKKHAKHDSFDFDQI